MIKLRGNHLAVSSARCSLAQILSLYMGLFSPALYIRRRFHPPLYTRIPPKPKDASGNPPERVKSVKQTPILPIPIHSRSSSGGWS